MLNIKNRETENTVRKLAQQLNVSLTEAVTVAVRHEMERIKGDRERYLEHLRKAAREVRTELNPDDWLDAKALYDDDGLPR
jgi:hypothetical protein